VGTLREWLLFFHLGAVLVAFVPAVAHVLVMRHAATENPSTIQRWSAFAARYDQLIYGPALIVAGAFGIWLVLSEASWNFGQSWILSALGLWVVMNGLLHGLVVPGERQMAAGDASGERKVQVGGMLLTFLFLAMLHLMIFKPGLS
jgi:uncharacterized membrane protein